MTRRDRLDIASMRAELQEVGIYDPAPSREGIESGAGGFYMSEKVPAPPRAYVVAYSNVETRETTVGVEMVATCPSCLRGMAFTWTRRPTERAESLVLANALERIAELERSLASSERRAAVADTRYRIASSMIVDHWSANEAWSEWLVERGLISWQEYLSV